MSTLPPVTSSVSAELMTNYITGNAVNSNLPFSVVLDSAGEPMLLSIGASAEDATRNDLFVLQRSDTEPTGWTLLSLTPDSSQSVQLLCASQGPKGDIVIVAAVDDGAGGSTFYVSNPLPPDTSAAIWSDPGAIWLPRPGAPAASPVNRMIMGDHRPEEGAPLVVVELNQGSTVERYFLDAGPDSTENLWTPYHLPQDQKELLDIAVGRMVTDIPRRGTFSLYTTSDGSLELSFAPVGMTQSGQPLSPKTFAAPAGASCLASYPDLDKAGSSILFTGGSGISAYDVDALSKARPSGTALPTAAGLSDLKQILALGQGADLRLWALTGGQVLYTLAYQGEKGQWSPALSVRTDVAQMAALSNRSHRSDELFAVSSATTPLVMRLWQDSTTGLWTESDMPAPASGSTRSFTCFTSVLRFLDQSGKPLANMPVQISASQLSYVTINGYYKTLDGSSTPIPVQTDVNGVVTLINRVSTLATPVFQVAADGLATPLIVDPSTALRQRMLSQLSTTNLGDITLSDGSKLVPDGVDPTTLANVQAGVNQLLGIAGGLPADGSAQSGGPTVGSVTGGSTSLLVRPSRSMELGVVGDVLGCWTTR